MQNFNPEDLQIQLENLKQSQESQSHHLSPHNQLIDSKSNKNQIFNSYIQSNQQKQYLPRQFKSQISHSNHKITNYKIKSVSHQISSHSNQNYSIKSNTQRSIHQNSNQNGQINPSNNIYKSQQKNHSRRYINHNLNSRVYNLTVNVMNEPRRLGIRKNNNKYNRTMINSQKMNKEQIEVRSSLKVKKQIDPMNKRMVQLINESIEANQRLKQIKQSYDDLKLRRQQLKNRVLNEDWREKNEKYREYIESNRGKLTNPQIINLLNEVQQKIQENKKIEQERIKQQNRIKQQQSILKKQKKIIMIDSQVQTYSEQIKPHQNQQLQLKQQILLQQPSQSQIQSKVTLNNMHFPDLPTLNVNQLDSNQLIKLGKKIYDLFKVRRKKINISVSKYKNCLHYQCKNIHILWYQTGYFYIGQYRIIQENHGHKIGYGIQKINKKSLYQGQFKNNKKSGFGTIKFQNKDCYVGQFSQGLQNGKGRFYRNQLLIYDGQWKSGKMEGFGKLRLRLHDIYQGYFLNGFQQGYGTLTLHNGDKYQGYFSHGKFNGLGVYIWANGQVYEGEFLNGYRHGKGVWKSKAINGIYDQYTGQYIVDKKSGIGKYIWNSGQAYYEGQFDYDQRHGLGIMQDEEGNITKAIWQRGTIKKRLRIGDQSMQLEQKQRNKQKVISNLQSKKSLQKMKSLQRQWMRKNDQTKDNISKNPCLLFETKLQKPKQKSGNKNIKVSNKKIKNKLQQASLNKQKVKIRHHHSVKFNSLII